MELNFFDMVGIEASLYWTVAVSMIIGICLRCIMIKVNDKNKFKLDSHIVFNTIVAVALVTILFPMVLDYFNNVLAYRVGVAIPLLIGWMTGSERVLMMLLPKNVLKFFSTLFTSIKEIKSGKPPSGLDELKELEKYKTSDELLLEKINAMESQINTALDLYIKTKNIDHVLNCYGELDDDIVKISLERDNMNLDSLILEKFDQMMINYSKIKKYKEDYFKKA